MIDLADIRDDNGLYAESNTWYMVTFLGFTLAISIIVVMMVLTSNFKLDFLLDLRSMATTYLHNVPNIMATLISSIFLTPKVIMSG